MPRGEFNAWDAFWSVVDRLGKPARGDLKAHAVYGLSLLFYGFAFLMVGFAYMVWDILAPFIRLAMFAAIVAGVLHYFHFINIWQFLPSGGGGLHLIPAGSGSGGGFGVFALLLAALCGSLATITAAAILVWIDTRRKRQEPEIQIVGRDTRKEGRVR